MSKSGTMPINKKLQETTERLRPNILKGKRLFPVAVNQFNKFDPDLAPILSSPISILKRDLEWEWNSDHE